MKKNLLLIAAIFIIALMSGCGEERYPREDVLRKTSNFNGWWERTGENLYNNPSSEEGFRAIQNPSGGYEIVDSMGNITGEFSVPNTRRISSTTPDRWRIGEFYNGLLAVEVSNMGRRGVRFLDETGSTIFAADYRDSVRLSEFNGRIITLSIPARGLSTLGGGAYRLRYDISGERLSGPTTPPFFERVGNWVRDAIGIVVILFILLCIAILKPNVLDLNSY